MKMAKKNKNIVRNQLYDDFDQKVKNIHDEMDLQHSYIKQRVQVTLFVMNFENNQKSS